MDNVVAIIGMAQNVVLPELVSLIMNGIHNAYPKINDLKL
jgi:hypothetical protein